MKTITYVITDPLGIHARPAGLLVKAAAPFESKLTLSTAQKSADLKRIIAVMSLGAKQGDTLVISAEGADEEAALEAIGTFLKENL